MSDYARTLALTALAPTRLLSLWRTWNFSLVPTSTPSMPD